MFFAAKAVVDTPQACLIDSTPPSFSGITGLVPNDDGSLLGSWSEATDASEPVDYDIFILPGSVSPAVLFAADPIGSTRDLSNRIYVDSNGATLLPDTYYTAGVRARDALGNQETNVVVLTALSKGVPTASIAELLRQVQYVVRGSNPCLAAEVDRATDIGAEIETSEIVADVTEVIDLNC